jgi:hypothetical protein
MLGGGVCGLLRRFFQGYFVGKVYSS